MQADARYKCVSVYTIVVESVVAVVVVVVIVVDEEVEVLVGTSIQSSA